MQQRPQNADYWRRLAGEARAKAKTMTLPAQKSEMRLIADYYERLAKHAGRAAGRKTPRSRN
jgi:hypothetical protein